MTRKHTQNVWYFYIFRNFQLLAQDCSQIDLFEINRCSTHMSQKSDCNSILNTKQIDFSYLRDETGNQDFLKNSGKQDNII